MTILMSQCICGATGLPAFAGNDELVTTDDAPQMLTSVREQKKRSLSLNLPQFPLIEKIYLSFPHELLA